MKFVSNDEGVFTGYRRGKERFTSTNLYLLNLKTEEIKQITNSDTEKEVKSTAYK